jgi:hypothetical protein
MALENLRVDRQLLVQVVDLLDLIGVADGGAKRRQDQRQHAHVPESQAQPNRG